MNGSKNGLNIDNSESPKQTFKYEERRSNTTDDENYESVESSSEESNDTMEADEISEADTLSSIDQKFQSSYEEINDTAENDTISSLDEPVEDQNAQSDGVMEDNVESVDENDENDIKSNHTFHDNEETLTNNGSRNSAGFDGNILEIDIQLGNRLWVINVKSTRKCNQINRT